MEIQRQLVVLVKTQLGCGIQHACARIFSQEACQEEQFPRNWKFGSSILLDGKIKPSKAIEMPNGRTFFLWGEANIGEGRKVKLTKLLAQSPRQRSDEYPSGNLAYTNSVTIPVLMS